jgi:hypothetical protein
MQVHYNNSKRQDTSGIVQLVYKMSEVFAEIFKCYGDK